MSPKYPCTRSLICQLVALVGSGKTLKKWGLVGEVRSLGCTFEAVISVPFPSLSFLHLTKWAASSVMIYLLPSHRPKSNREN